jgi:hypothetical protein
VRHLAAPGTPPRSRTCATWRHDMQPPGGTTYRPPHAATRVVPSAILVRPVDPLTTGPRSRLPWRRASSPEGSRRVLFGQAQSRQPSHQRELLHGLVAADLYHRQPGPCCRSA